MKINLMNLAFLFLITATSNISLAQSVKIKGNIAGLNTDELTVYYDDKTGSKSEKIKHVGGRFTWTGALAPSQKIMLAVDKKVPILIFVEAGTVELTGHIDSARAVKVVGSKLHDQWLTFQSDLMKAQTAKREANKDASRDQAGFNYRIVKRDFTEAFAGAHPDNPISLSAVSDLSMFGIYIETLPAFEKLSDRLKNTPDGKRLTERLMRMKRTQVGEKMVDFVQKDANGKPVKLLEVLKENKYVLIDFWASWCKPCRAENPNVLKAYKEFNNKGFNVVGISIDTEAEKWKKAIKEDGMPWIHVSDLKPRNEVAEYYGIGAIPATLLVDADGKIVAVDVRGERLHQKLRELLN